MQAQVHTAANVVTFKGYAEKSKAKRALVKSFEINELTVPVFLREQDGKWGFLLKDGVPFVPFVEAEAAAPAAELPTQASILDKVATDLGYTDEHDDTPTISSAFAMMVTPPTPPAGAATTVVRDGKIVDPATAAADDKGDHAVEAGVDPCPLCGAHHSSQTWANEGVSAFCHGCGKTYSVSTGREVRTGFKRDDVNKGYKIEKNRAEQNGVKRPSAGTLCGQVWAALDAVHATRMPVASDLDDIANANGWNRNNVSCEFYQWRKFNGIKGRQVKSA
jgi:hypothetical protein